jgi:putative DNA primase/helicase
MNASQQILALVDAALPPSAPAVPPRPEKTQASQMGEPAKKPVAAEGEAAPAPLEVLDEITDEQRAEARRIEEELRREALHPELARLPQTDLGNAERFRARFGHLFRYNKTLGWLFWDNKRWARNGAEQRVLMAAHETARAIQDEAKACFEIAEKIADELGADTIETATAKKKPKPEAGGAKKRKRKGDDAPDFDAKTLRRLADYKFHRMLAMDLMDWGRDSEMNARMMPIDKHAAPYLAVDIDALDTDPWKFNVANGTLIFDCAARSVSLKPHDPADLITKISPVAYDPAATCPQFDRFFDQVQEKDDQRFLLGWQGYSLTGDNNVQKLVLLHGQGRNGKGVFIRICAHIGGDYAKTTPIETFLNEGAPRNASQPTPERAALPAVRMLYTNEPDKGSVLNTAFIKLVTGGDAISARELNKPQFQFVPVFKLSISGNHKPVIKDQTESIWRRLELVPWTTIIPEGGEDLNLDAKLRGEASGVLNRLILGLKDWMANGLVRSKRAEKATQQYRAESDQLGRWLTDCVRKAPGKRVQSTVAYELFNAWATATGGAQWKNAGFTNAMKDRGFETLKSNVMFFLDIELTKNVSDFVDHEGKAIVAGAAPPMAARSKLMTPEDEDEFDG